MKKILIRFEGSEEPYYWESEIPDNIVVVEFKLPNGSKLIVRIKEVLE